MHCADKMGPRYGAAPKNQSPSVGVVPCNLDTTPTIEAALNRKGEGGGGGGRAGDEGEDLFVII